MTAISLHGPNTVDEVRVLGDSVQASPKVHIASTPKEDSFQQILTLLQTMMTPKTQRMLLPVTRSQTPIPAHASIQPSVKLVIIVKRSNIISQFVDKL